MSDYNKRIYKNSDYEVTREIFAQGITVHTNEVFKHAFSLPRTCLFMLFVSLLTLLTTGSIVLSILPVTTEMIILWLCSKIVFHSYVQRCLSDNMKDIHKYYLERDGYCFWVAESAGQVVGTVAAVPSPNPGEEKYLELKRLSVDKSHRGKGIARALCRRLIDFARERGCKGVDLETTLAQKDAQWLYEKIGFRLMRTFTPPIIILKIIDFRGMIYQYDIPSWSRH